MAQTYTDKPTLAAWNAVESAVAEKCEIVVGSYTGNSSAGRTINLGVTPKAVLVRQRSNHTSNTISYNDVAYLAVLAIGSNDGNALRLTNGGFIVSAHPTVNESNCIYLYIAFV